MAENYSTQHHHILSYLHATLHSTNSTRYSSNPEFCICLVFSGLYRYSIRDEHATVSPVGSTIYPLREIAVFFDLGGFLCRENSRKTVGERLTAWRSCTTRGQHEDLVAFFLRRTRTAVVRMPARHNYLQVEFRVEFDCLETIARSPIDRAIWGSMDEDVRMVPTDESAIENMMVRKKILTGSVDGDCICVVCMDEFDRDCEVVCMPCLHVFHGDCIQKWLRTSHYCPICRFEMPTS